PEPGPSVRPASFAFPENPNALARIDQRDTVVDRNPRALDAPGHPLAAIERDDRHLIGNVSFKRRRRHVHHCFRINSAHHISPKMVTTQLAPDPPRFSASPSECRVSCRSPASQRICCTMSRICATPVAPTGWPLDFNPPLVFMGLAPLRAVYPAAEQGPPCPRGTNPRSSSAMISAMVKQSCSSPNWMSAGCTPAILYALAAAAFTAGNVVMSAFWSRAKESDACAMPSTRTGLLLNS